MIIHPQGFRDDDFKGWADQMSNLIQEDVPNFLIYMPGLGDTWQDWALCIVGSQDELGQDSPDPATFDTWKEWAERFFETQSFMG